jgi:hypothetical protein
VAFLLFLKWTSIGNIVWNYPCIVLKRGEHEGELELRVVTGREKWTSYVEGRIGLGLDRNFIHFLLGFIKGPNKIVKEPMGRDPNWNELKKREILFTLRLCYILRLQLSFRTAEWEPTGITPVFVFIFTFMSLEISQVRWRMCRFALDWALNASSCWNRVNNGNATRGREQRVKSDSEAYNAASSWVPHFPNIYRTCLFYNNNVVVQNTWCFMLNVLGSFFLNFVG